MTEITAAEVGDINNRTFKVLANFVLKAMLLHGFTIADIAILNQLTGNLEQYLVNEIATIHNNKVKLNHTELLKTLLLKLKEILPKS